MKKLADGVQTLSRAVKSGYKTLETAVVSGYQAVEHGAVTGFEALTDQCVKVLFAKDGETAKEAKARLAATNDHKNEYKH